MLPDSAQGLTSHATATRLLSLNGVSHVYQDGKRAVNALQDIDLEVSPGEFVSVLGTSGCGKSTLLRIASGLLSPSDGSVTFDGSALTEPTDQISMIFQDAVMLPWFTVLENVTLPDRIAGRSIADANEEARGLLASVGLHGFENVYPDSLSGGMRQRAAIVRSLMTDPKLLLMDEPFGALDAMTREGMNLLLSATAENSGFGALLITHSIPEAVLLADRVVVMTPRPGRILDELHIDLARPRTRETMSDPRFVSLCAQLRNHFRR